MAINVGELIAMLQNVEPSAPVLLEAAQEFSFENVESLRFHYVEPADYGMFQSYSKHDENGQVVGNPQKAVVIYAHTQGAWSSWQP